MASISAGFAIFLLFAYALSWGCACLGMVSKGPESAQGVGLVILFPLAIVSNALVPTERMPAVLRAVADWNPVSAVTSAARTLWHNPNPSGIHPRLAHAAPGGGIPSVVRRPPVDLRPAGHLAVSAAHHGVTHAGRARPASWRQNPPSCWQPQTPWGALSLFASRAQPGPKIDHPHLDRGRPTGTRKDPLAGSTRATVVELACCLPAASASA